MPQFQYENYHDPFAATLGSLIGDQGRIRAQQALNTGQARAQMAQGIGSAVSGAAQAVAQHQADAPRRRMEALQLRGAEQSAVDETLLRQALSMGDLSRATAFLKSQGGVGIVALQKLTAMAAQEQDRTRQLQEQHDEDAGEIGYQIVKGGGSIDALQSALSDAVQKKRLSNDEATQLFGVASEKPDKIPDLARQLMARSKSYRPLLDKIDWGKPGDVGFDPLTHQPIAGAGVPEKKPDYTINGQRFSGTTNQPLLDAPVPPQTVRNPPSIEEQLLEAIAKGDTAKVGQIKETLRTKAEASKDPAQVAMAKELGELRAEEARARLQKIYEGKEPNQGQFTSAGYAGRIEQAGQILDKLEKDVSGMNYASFYAQSKLPSAVQSGQFQSYDQAARNLVNAILRRESGAAISESEFENARKQYLPQPGDTAQTLSQKKANRDYVFKTMKAASGRAYEPAADVGVRDRARAALQQAGKVTDDAAVDLFLKNNPTFKE